MSLELDYETRIKTRTDINELMPVLREYATQASSIVEFGVRTGHSTCALLSGLAGRGPMNSYDINKPQCSFDEPNWTFTQADTSKLETIPECDLLFIDTLHTSAQVEAELKHALWVNKFILFHDTMLFGDRGEGRDGGYGITHAIYSFLAANRSWQVKEHYPYNNGLLVLERTV